MIQYVRAVWYGFHYLLYFKGTLLPRLWPMVLLSGQRGRGAKTCCVVGFIRGCVSRPSRSVAALRLCMPRVR